MGHVSEHKVTAYLTEVAGARKHNVPLIMIVFLHGTISVLRVAAR